MSSINKSGKRFTPKIKQRTRRVPGLMTPQSSQTVHLTRTPQASPVSVAAPPSPISQKPTNGLATSTQEEEQKKESASDETSTSIQNDHIFQDDGEQKAEEQKTGKGDVVGKTDGDDEAAVLTNKSDMSSAPFIGHEGDAERIKPEQPPKVKESSGIKLQERKASVTGSGHLFTQPASIVHRTRLNSLSIPTPLSTAQSTSRRGSVASASNSRRGSVILPSANPIAPGGLGSRRGSVVGGLGPITPGSRRGSVNIRPVFVPIGGGDRSRRGSVTNNGDEKPTPIPILKTNKKRRTSVNYGPKKRKDVNVGGISIGGSLAIKKSDFSSLNTTRSSANKENGDGFLESDTENGGPRDMTTNRKLGPADNGDGNEGDGKGIEQMKEKKLELTEFEKENKQKWLLDRKMNKFVLVDTEPLVKDKSKQSDFELEHEIESLSELGQMRRANHAKLGDSIKFNAKKIKLEDLCKPFLPVGELSSQYERAMEAEKRLQEARVKRREIREKARQLRMSEKDVMKLSENGASLSTELSEKERLQKVKELMEKDRTEEHKKHVVPLLQIQGNKLTYSHESTVVDRREETNTEMEKVEENPFENIVTSSSYSRRTTTLRWTPQEVAELLKAISLWGTDFGLIAKLFPHRTRKQIKAKFLLEEKVHPHLIEFALLRKLPVDVREYSGKTGIEFKTLDEYNKQIQELKLKHEEELKAMAQAREQAHAEDRAQQNLHGDGSQGVPTRRSRKAVIAEFRKNEEVVGSIESSGN
ncbi:hypothetical protein PMKS-003678 [Pichia membranifaciens]|uniref:SANT domain-containing protein n=1 Tax=Pichia membranifaciens TaxID=4926 RepID=A0A1Q2YKV2_9ASCO|nr:hypothetical protein PMKS-003678 [Pichia membranifaciens]